LSPIGTMTPMPDDAPSLEAACALLEHAVARLEQVAEAIARREEERAKAPSADALAATMAEAAERLDAVIARLSAVLEPG